jgi:hypothetical protein
MRVAVVFVSSAEDQWASTSLKKKALLSALRYQSPHYETKPRRFARPYGSCLVSGF